MDSPTPANPAPAPKAPTVEELQKSLADTNKRLELINTELQAAKDALTARNKEHQDLKSLHEKLSADHATITKNLSDSQAKLLDTRRKAIINAYKLKEEHVKTLNESQLDALEAVLPNVPAPSNNPNFFDAGGTGGKSNDVSQMSARDKILAGMNSGKP